MLLTGSWDGTLKQWDHRAAQPLVATASLPDKVYTMSLSPSGKLVVGMASQHVHIYDVRNMSEAWQQRTSSLTPQTRCVRCNTDDTGYVLSTVEGRVAVECVEKKRFEREREREKERAREGRDEKRSDTQERGIR
jgi:cell cycle arrest protein BUB3